MSRKYRDIKVMWSGADKMDGFGNQPSQRLLALSPPLFLFIFFLKKTFLETLITVEGCCKAGKEIDHFYSVVHDKM